MSGGSYDYAYNKAEDMADSLCSKTNSPLRRAFGRHLNLVAKAMHDIEWVDSGDYGTGDENDAIAKVLVDPKRLQLEILKQDAEDLIKQLQTLIK